MYMDLPHITVDINPISHPIPSCLLQSDTICDDFTPVSLPQRFLRVSKSGEDEDGEECPGAREKDLASALQWVKQQMVMLRKDDMKLMRRFLDLHAAMLELKWLYEGASSMSDVSSYNGSNLSLDDVMESSLDHCVTNDVHDTQFRERTTSLQIPRKSRVTRIRWKSNEII